MTDILIFYLKQYIIQTENSKLCKSFTQEICDTQAGKNNRLKLSLDNSTHNLMIS
jgi:hypothetical protein